MKLENVAINASATTLRAEINLNAVAATAGYVEVQWAKLEEGSSCTAWIMPNPAEETARCKQYYQIFGFVENAILFKWYQAAGAYCGTSFSFPAMRVAPSVGIVGSWYTVGAASSVPGYTGGSTTSISFQIQKDGSGGEIDCQTNATGGITLNSEIAAY